jgi:hypothetical protein
MGDDYRSQAVRKSSGEGTVDWDDIIVILVGLRERERHLPLDYG